MSFFFRGKVWLQFVRDYAPYNGAVKFRKGLITALDSIEAECLVACGYAVAYSVERRPEQGSSESTMGAAS